MFLKVEGTENKDKVILRGVKLNLWMEAMISTQERYLLCKNCD